ncbi:MAG: hypothetical protein AAF851_17985 [Myxococcota bacterium]
MSYLRVVAGWFLASLLPACGEGSSEDTGPEIPARVIESLALPVDGSEGIVTVAVLIRAPGESVDVRLLWNHLPTTSTPSTFSTTFSYVPPGAVGNLPNGARPPFYYVPRGVEEQPQETDIVVLDDGTLRVPLPEASIVVAVDVDLSVVDGLCQPLDFEVELNGDKRFSLNTRTRWLPPSNLRPEFVIESQAEFEADEFGNLTITSADEWPLLRVVAPSGVSDQRVERECDTDLVFHSTLRKTSLSESASMDLSVLKGPWPDAARVTGTCVARLPENFACEREWGIVTGEQLSSRTERYVVLDFPKPQVP